MIYQITINISRRACARGAGCIILRALRPRFFSGAALSGEDK
jgi:hypothetical protein